MTSKTKFTLQGFQSGCWKTLACYPDADLAQVDLQLKRAVRIDGAPAWQHLRIVEG